MNEHREGRVIDMPSKRTEGGCVRSIGVALVALFMVGCTIASLLLMVAVIVGAWRFIAWAVGA